MNEKFMVEFYETEKGERPSLDFINTLEVKLRAKVFRDLKLLEEKGNELRLPYSENLGDGIFELRTIQGNNIVRNLYFFINSKSKELQRRLQEKASRKRRYKMTLTEALKEQLKDETFKKEYEALEPEYEIISSLIDARKSNNVTQKQLSEATGIAQSDISKIENGSANPTLKLLQRLADGLNMSLKVEFVPKSSAVVK